jgi:isopenicillin N synthase-like dioxygenase
VICRPTGIPFVDIGALSDGASAAREAADAALMESAVTTGFLTVSSPAIDAATAPPAMNQLLRVFGLPLPEQQRLWRARYNSGNHFLYRGWNPPNDAEAPNHMYDLGPDLAHPATDGVHDDDPLLEPTPLPPDDALPGWRDAAAEYFRCMEHVGVALMRSLARSLQVPETFFDGAFTGGISTLRLIRYEALEEPPADDPMWIEHDGERRLLTRGAHQDSGFVTLLAQTGVGGLQALSTTGTWEDVPADPGRVAVNFGGVLERWTGGRIRATKHRVLGSGELRHSVPFFFEPRVDAVIAPLPADASGAAAFEPFTYGDHLWSAMLRFPNFHGLEGRRAPRGLPPITRSSGGPPPNG